MSEPRLYKSVKECGLKACSLAVSFKYHVWVVATIGMFTGLIFPWLWIAFSAALVGVKGWEKFIFSVPQQVTDIPESTE